MLACRHSNLMKWTRTRMFSLHVASPLRAGKLKTLVPLEGKLTANPCDIILSNHKHFYPGGSLFSGMTMSTHTQGMLGIICYGLHDHISTQLNTYEQFWTHVLNSTLHHQIIKTPNEEMSLRKMVFVPTAVKLLRRLVVPFKMSTIWTALQSQKVVALHTE